MDAEELFHRLFGFADETDIAVWQMALRAVLIYTAVLLLLRIGKKRSLGNATAFDFFLGVMMGSIASRAVTGDAPAGGALAACAAMIALHWLFSMLTVYSHWLGGILKGHATLLVKDGKIDEKRMRAAHVSERDLEAELRLHDVASLAHVAEARLERNGSISIVTKKT